MQFRCGLEDGFDLCMNNGICKLNNSTQKEECVCPEGYHYDYLGFFHFKNCTYQEEFVLGFFIGLTVLTVPLLWVMGRSLRKVRGKMAGLGVSIVIWTVLSWFSTLSAYLQNGFYEGSLFFLLCQIYVSYGVTCYVLPVFLFSFSQAKANMLHNFGISVAFVMCLASTGLAVVIWMHIHDQEDQTTYNTYMFALLALTAFDMFLFPLYVVFVLRNSFELIFHQSTNTALVERVTKNGFKAQLKTLIFFSLLVHLTGLIALILLWICYSFHSMPYFYIPWGMINASALPMVIAWWYAFGRNRKNTSQEEHHTSSPRQESEGQPEDRIQGLGIIIRNKWKKKKIKNRLMTIISEEPSQFESRFQTNSTFKNDTNE